MKTYCFDITLVGAIRVTAPDELTARKMLKEALDAADANLGAWPDGSPILAEVSLAQDDEYLAGRPTCFDPDGEPK